MGRLIRRQRILTQKTVEDEPSHKLADMHIQIPQTPQYTKT
jgi:hypothetical protein